MNTNTKPRRPNNPMKIYLLTQSHVGGYDTYDSIVVAAETSNKAKAIHPYPGHGDMWPNDPKHVSAKFIGNAKSGTKSGVILASFNAG